MATDNLNELILKEIKSFKESMNIGEWSITEKKHYYEGVSKAFDDAFSQFSRRKQLKYALKKEELITPIVDKLYEYLLEDNYSFEDCFLECIKCSQNFFGEINISYGIAQKFINMSFKYLYCFNGVENYEEKFQECHMPLDKYTIKWIKKIGNIEINRKLNQINNAWSNIDDKELYDSIQNLITKELEKGAKYQISYNDKLSEEEKKCVLPNNKLCAEFIIWHQEKINELYRIITKAKSDWFRLGIDKI